MNLVFSRIFCEVFLNYLRMSLYGKHLGSKINKIPAKKKEYLMSFFCIGFDKIALNKL